MRRVSALGLILGALAQAGLAQAPARISGRALDGNAPAAVDLAAVRPVVAKHAMVVSDQHLATEVGVAILKAGGNAVDAAVAVGYAQAVTNPCCGNIGGGGFMVIHLTGGQNLFLDFREKAPGAATATMFQDAAGNVIPGMSANSWKAIGVPGTVMGLNTALAKYGTMRLRRVMAPAIRLARQGFVLAPGDAKILASRADDFATEPNVAAIFLNHGRPFAAGERLVQPQLARTLELIARGGSDAFYKGPIAREIVAASAANGGLFTMRDFADYTAQWDAPLHCSYRGFDVIAAPPPSSGGTTVCEILQTVAGYPLGEWGYGSVRSTHYLVEAEKRAFADRNSALGDPAFVQNPVDMLLAPARAVELRAQISPDRATPSSAIHGIGGALSEGTNTTHFSIVDAKGNAVAVTYTINFLFGVGRIAGDTGFFLNDEMDDFTAKPGTSNGFQLLQGTANAIAGGKRPLSSMAPTILLKDGRPFLVTGSPGGSTIITTVTQSIVNVVDYGMNVQAAIDAPRLHHQWMPDQVMIEPGALTPENQAALETMGHSFLVRTGWGADEAILIDPATGLLQGANDRRRPAGLAAGY